MKPEHAPLFSPYRLKNLNLPNRIVMAPMTRSFSPGGLPGEDVARYYRRRAEGGVGLIVSEGTAVPHPYAKNDPKVPDFFGAALDRWATVIGEVHAAGGLMMPQLWHVGLRRTKDDPRPRDARAGPSGIEKLDAPAVAEPMTDADVADVIAAFATAAASAQRLGFDGVEIHGAHGYVIDQFFWDKTNRRADRWGGGMEERTRFAAAIVAAVRGAVGPDFPVLLRWSQWKGLDYAAKLAATPQELARFLAPLVDAGADVFHCSQRRFWEPEFDGSALNLAGWVKKLTGKPVITVGSVGLDEEFIATFRGAGASAGQEHFGRLLDMLAREEVDLVAVGRALIVNPDWPHLIRDGRMDALKPYTPEALKELV